MTLQTIQFESVSLREIGSGTITAELFQGTASQGTLSDIAENATRNGRFTGTVTSKPAGDYDLQVRFNGITISEPNEAVTLALAVGTYVATSAAELDSATVTKIDNILTDTGTTLPAQISAISGGASLEDIIAGVQSVSGGIAAAQDESALYITIGDTWTQDVESLGNLTDKTVVFAIKSKARDADNAAVVLITEGTGLTRLNGAATTAGWGSIEILDEAAGDVRLRLESDATSLLTSGTYVDAIKALEDGDDRTLRQRGRTIVAAGVIADIT
jgi:hypothetical protein